MPTAAGREDEVIAWVERWTAERRNLVLSRDAAGNLFITRRRLRKNAPRPRAAARPAPLFITAHMDHPAFVVRAARGREIDLEFRGSVHPPYFERARLEIIGSGGMRRRARIVSVDTAARPFTRVVARLDSPARGAPAPGDIARWRFGGSPLPRVARGLLYTHGCDDLAGVAAALAALDELRGRRETGHVGVMLTRAEEVGFIGATAACQARSIPRNARLICLETSRSFAESPIGAGPIVRVGDRMSVFEPSLTNAISLLMTEHAKARPAFKWQRKLMPGGTCEATTFSAYGYRSTCLCLPLGNYHNMMDIDGVTSGRARARVGPEFISVDDFHGLVEMLIVCATRLDVPKTSSLASAMEDRMRRFGHVLGPQRHRTSFDTFDF
jgi:endoglucanase